MALREKVERMRDREGPPRSIVTVWLYGGPHDGDSMDVGTPLPATITTTGKAVYTNAGPEIDESGQPLSTWRYQWAPPSAPEAPLER